jgi:sigma-B regulation protein RsbU (phosphoserine phosphatase)
MLYGILNPHNGDFTYCSAGHHPALLLRARDGSIKQLKSTGLLLGVTAESSWKQVKVNIAAGDVLVLYTDGITDAQNRADETFGFDRLLEALQVQQGRTAQEIRDALRAAVRSWVGTAPQFDDITLMVVMRDKE